MICRRQKTDPAFEAPFHSETELRLLGVIFQENLQWDMHIDYVMRSASKRVFILKEMKKIKSITKRDLIHVYFSQIRSIIEYNCPVFVGLNTRNNCKLNKLQRRCHRIICGKGCSCDLFPNLESRRDDLAMKVFHKMMQPAHQLNSLMPLFLPSGKRLSFPFCNTLRRKSSFIPMCTLRFNKQN